MELFKIFGTIALENAGAIKGIEETTGKAEGASGKMVAAFKKIGSAVATYLAVDKIIDFGAACLEAAANAQATESQFAQVFGDLSGSASEGLAAIAESAGIAENRMKGSYTKIAAFAKTTGMETADTLSLADRALIAVADSAAFYDRSLEETTESLQSFLKGNYENDAALGLSCTETTRNAAANELYGKSFQDLSEAQKQLTLLQMVEDANAASGALGQAARESDTWTNQTGNLKQAWTDFQAEIGEHVLPTVVGLVERFSEFVGTATEKVDPAVQFLTEKFQGLKDWLAEIGTYASETFAPIIADLEPVFTTVKDAVQYVIDKFTEYVTSGEAAEDATNLLKDAIDLVADAYETVKGFIEDCITAWQNAQTWINDHKTAVQLLATAFTTLTVAIGAFTASQAIASAGGVVYLAQLAATAVGVYALDAAQKIATISGTAFGAVMAFITSPITLVVLAIGALITIIVLCVKHWDEIKAKVIEVASAIAAKWEEIKAAITEKVQSMVSAVKTKFQEFKDSVSAKVEEIKSAVSEKWEEIKQSITDAITGAKEKVGEIWGEIKGVFADALNVGKKIIDDIKQGINDAWTGLTEWFSGLWNAVFGNLTANVTVNKGVSGGGTGGAVMGSHASGLDYVPFDGYIAELHKGEMVLPAKDASMLRNGTVANYEIANILTNILEAIQEGNSQATVMKLNNREFGRLVKAVN